MVFQYLGEDPAHKRKLSRNYHEMQTALTVTNYRYSTNSKPP